MKASSTYKREFKRISVLYVKIFQLPHRKITRLFSRLFEEKGHLQIIVLRKRPFRSFFLSFSSSVEGF